MEPARANSKQGRENATHISTDPPVTSRRATVQYLLYSTAEPKHFPEPKHDPRAAAKGEAEAAEQSQSTVKSRSTTAEPKHL